MCECECVCVCRSIRKLISLYALLLILFAIFSASKKFCQTTSRAFSAWKSSFFESLSSFLSLPLRPVQHDRQPFQERHFICILIYQSNQIMFRSLFLFHSFLSREFLPAKLMTFLNITQLSLSFSVSSQLFCWVVSGLSFTYSLLRELFVEVLSLPLLESIQLFCLFLLHSLTFTFWTSQRVIVVRNLNIWVNWTERYEITEFKT